MKKLENKVSIVTGAGAGMGKAIAQLFAAEGSKVVATDINQESLNTLKKAIEAEGGEVSILIANMAVEADIEKMIAFAVKTYGTLDILVNNAGIMDSYQPTAEVDNSTMEKLMKVNFEGPFKAMRSALKIFLAKGKGVIVNNASVAGIKGGAAGTAYTVSKHALIGLTKSTGYLYSKSGIRCNAIATGAVNTNMSQSFDMSKVTPLVNDRIMTGIALNPRFAEPVEIAKVALFLASDDSSFINGHALVADGGWSVY